MLSVHFRRPNSMGEETTDSGRATNRPLKLMAIVLSHFGGSFATIKKYERKMWGQRRPCGEIFTVKEPPPKKITLGFGSRCKNCQTFLNFKVVTDDKSALEAPPPFESSRFRCMPFWRMSGRRIEMTPPTDHPPLAIQKINHFGLIKFKPFPSFFANSTKDSVSRGPKA